MSWATVGSDEGGPLAQIRTSEIVSPAPSSHVAELRHEAAVYWIRDRRGRVIYVGMTGSIWSRMAQHRQASLWWASAATVEWAECASRDEARQLEIREIARYQPDWNVNA